MTIVVCLAGTVYTHADVVDFNGLAGTNVPGNSSFTATETNFAGINVAEVDGFYFGGQDYDSILGTAYSSDDSGGNFYNGSDYFRSLYPHDKPLVIEKTDSSLFNFNSIELGQVGFGYDMIISVTGYDALDFVIKTELVQLDNISVINDIDGNDGEYFAFTGFNNLSRLEIAATTPHDWLIIDNFEHSVPEPMTLSLLALGGIAAIRRRRKL